MMEVLPILLYSFGALCIIFTLLQLTPYRHWVFRLPEYLCRQLLVILGVVLVFSIIVLPLEVHNIIFISMLMLTAGYLFYKIFPYTRFGKVEVKEVDASGTYYSLPLLIINVLQHNDQYKKVCDAIQSTQPDIVLLIETDEKWNQGISSIKNQYTDVITICRDDTYGMILLSKHPILKENIRQTYDETPSIRCTIKINEENIIFYGLHPKPPSPTEADTSIPKDVELRYVANEIKSEFSGKKIIVLGDMNDVAWSSTTTSFLQTASLRDPRRGRGSITTFPTYLPIMGFPLDQVFCSNHFRVHSIRRLQEVGSDHYPLEVILGFQ